MELRTLRLGGTLRDCVRCRQRLLIDTTWSMVCISQTWHPYYFKTFAEWTLARRGCRDSCVNTDYEYIFSLWAHTGELIAVQDAQPRYPCIEWRTWVSCYENADLIVSRNRLESPFYPRGTWKARNYVRGGGKAALLPILFCTRRLYTSLRVWLQKPFTPLSTCWQNISTELPPKLRVIILTNPWTLTSNCSA